MKCVWSSAIGVSLLISCTDSAQAETWAVASGNANWVNQSSWVENLVPNSVGASAVFNSPTASRNMDLDGQFTVGTVTFNSTNSPGFTQNIRNFQLFGDLLTFDAVGDGPAFINAIGSGADNSRLQSDMFFQDTVVANVSNIVGNATAGALTISGNVTGPGGFTKTGDGRISFTFNANDTGQIKSWEGPTNVNGGRWRTSLGGTNAMLTSSFTIDGGQVEMIGDGSYTFGLGPVKLSGNGPATGPFAAFPGVIRPSTNTVTSITNPVVLQSDSVVHIQGSATGAITFSGIVSGGGGFIQTALNSDANLGRIIFTNTNTYTGGTTVNGGRMEVSGTDATFGDGDVFVRNPALVLTNGAGIAGAISRLVISTGVSNAISDTAVLSIDGSMRGIVELGAGINETVGSLILGGVVQTAAGSYGAPGSGANFELDQFFAGSGVVTIAASPGLNGDYNGDGTVNAADYVLWRKSPGDFGTVPDGYDIWRENYGESNAGSGNGAVPEPTALGVIGVLVSNLASCRWRRANNRAS